MVADWPARIPSCSPPLPQVRMVCETMSRSWRPLVGHPTWGKPRGNVWTKQSEESRPEQYQGDGQSCMHCPFNCKHLPSQWAPFWKLCQAASLWISPNNENTDGVLSERTAHTNTPVLPEGATRGVGWHSSWATAPGHWLGLILEQHEAGWPNGLGPALVQALAIIINKKNRYVKQNSTIRVWIMMTFQPKLQ